MTQMIYRPQTSDKWYEGIPVEKTVFCTVLCDAIVVDEELAPIYESQGWFTDPNKMIDKPVKKNDRSINTDK